MANIPKVKLQFEDVNNVNIYFYEEKTSKS